MATGRIKNVVADRGFGFIKPNDGGPEVFFLHSTLTNGQRLTDDLRGRLVEYQAEHTEKGLPAFSVTLG